MNPEIRKTSELISRADKIVIACHINPDGDTIGSMMALGLGLAQIGKHAVMLSADEIPKRFRNLSGADKIVRKTAETFDLAIAVDCNSPRMLGTALEIFKRTPTVLEIDHHEFRESFGTAGLIDKEASSVGQIIYHLLKALNVGIDKDIAESILASIIVETNSFRLPSVTAETFTICADLMKTGTDFARLTDLVYWAESRETILLSGICLSRCVFLRDGKVVWSIIHTSDLETVGGKSEDVDAVPDVMRRITDVKVSVLFREMDENMLRVSLRSKGAVNVAVVAEHFGGGGHYDVAGCFIPNTPEAMKELLDRIVL